MGLLDGRSAAITGAAQGIGFAIAERLVSEGARVALGDIDLAAAEIAAAALGGPSVAVAARWHAVRPGCHLGGHHGC